LLTKYFNFGYFYNLETTRIDQEQRDHCAGPEALQRHQHRHDQTASTQVNHQRNPQDGRHCDEQRRN
jgi:hypothetical protein